METPQGAEDAQIDLRSTDDVLSESVERVRSSRQLIDAIDERLARSQQILDEE
jgi:hypothetical protein